MYIHTIAEDNTHHRLKNVHHLKIVHTHHQKDRVAKDTLLLVVLFCEAAFLQEQRRSPSSLSWVNPKGFDLCPETLCQHHLTQQNSLQNTVLVAAIEGL
jgi:hypothetical protein